MPCAKNGGNVAVCNKEGHECHDIIQGRRVQRNGRNVAISDKAQCPARYEVCTTVTLYIHRVLMHLNVNDAHHCLTDASPMPYIVAVPPTITLSVRT